MSQSPTRPPGNRHHVVIIGSGFGGIFAAKELADADVDVTLISRTNHHLFQPLLYQVATGILSSGEIAVSTRQILSQQQNARVIKGDVVDIDVEDQVVRINSSAYERSFEYDSLIVAAGAGQSYFGNDHFAQYAPGLKTVDNALELRARIVTAFERAEVAQDPVEVERLLTFVIVGAGATGVEIAGQIAEMANRSFKDDYDSFEPSQAKIILLDGASQVLPPFGKRLGRNAQRQLEKLGVTVRLNAMVTDLDANTVTFRDTKTDEETTIESFTKIWSAGVQASPLGKMIADQTGAEVDRSGRVIVNSQALAGETNNIYVIGDMMNLNNLPGVAQVAIQTGEYAAQSIKNFVEHNQDPREREPFEYFDKGSMAIVSRFSAVVKMGKVEVTGFIGWIMWLVVHVMFLVGFRNRFVSMITWGLNALSPRRYNLAITSQQMHGHTGLSKLKVSNGEESKQLPEVRDTTNLGED
ncbi:NAD(P)/FAD-dependent oxidoreductase [Corynebacterium cystitidis]|uniref:NADH:ubiquinone reductase (non-electrogenic) n=1 Tax=Corynebacterium cystitidis DSM 20524 TaxID=1121357 RepID=A0A1H9PS12_9CORY|nr:NAD(P)/FAD-dependent oxidoreductase [Corynebacterium cystitidis]WJY82404.1 NADH dehydrogenase [Corynebacterium cystitidis DSM 20524]SER50898.1 NADH dehydrogenase [Corynebacterium cystitidis DSM 20524]SNV75923.1 NADH dehydrogenase, FAD-containing subunit [Corynebacterium cystitidis]